MFKYLRSKLALQHNAPKKWRKSAAAIALLATLSSQCVMAKSLEELPQLIEQNGQSVVNIQIEGRTLSPVAHSQPNMPNSEDMPDFMQRFFRDMPQGSTAQQQQAIGSGFIIGSDGYIVTNSHVVDNAAVVTVTLADKREFQAEVVGSDEKSDIALLKISAKNLPVVEFGNSEQLQVGQWVFAIGNPFGFEQTATQGIVSALSRRLPDGTYVPFVQTDVAVNPGNSGGPLFDLDGRVVGVNSQIYSRSGGYMGVSFAIPVNLVKDITEQLKNKGYVSRGRLGVTIQNMDHALARSFNLDRPHGALVADVEEQSPAAAAGILSGDIILSFAGESIESAGDLPLAVGSTQSGTQTDLLVLRNGEEKSLQVTVGQLEEQQPKSQQLSRQDEGSLGLGVANVPSHQLAELGIDNGGVLVKQVIPGSPAAKAGIRTNDIVVSFNSRPVSSTQMLADAVKQAPEGKPAAVLVIRNQAPRYLAVVKPQSLS